MTVRKTGLVAVLIYWFRVLRRPMDARLKRRHVGGSAVLTLGAGMIVLWVQERPMTLPGRYKWGELAGVMAVYLSGERLTERGLSGRPHPAPGPRTRRASAGQSYIRWFFRRYYRDPVLTRRSGC